MTMVNLKEAFEVCEYAFYKEVSVKDEAFQCSLYSVTSAYINDISIPLINFDTTVHRLSLEIIKLRSHEWMTV